MYNPIINIYHTKVERGLCWGEMGSDEEEESMVWWDTNVTHILSYVYTLTQIQHERKKTISSRKGTSGGDQKWETEDKCKYRDKHVWKFHTETYYYVYL